MNGTDSSAGGEASGDSAGDIALGENFEAVVAQGLGGYVGVFDV